MKTNTDVLINTIEGGQKWYKTSPYMATKYYEAVHHTDNIYLLWMESKLLKHRRAFPCVMIEDGYVMVFRGATSFKKSGENVTLIKRWNLFVSPKNINTDFDVSELDEVEFKEKFLKAQSNELLPKDEETEDEEYDDEDTEDIDIDETDDAEPEA